MAWVVQRAIARYATARAAAQEDPRRTVGIVTASMIGRGWLVAAYDLRRGDGSATTRVCPRPCSSSLVVTVYFTVYMILRPFESKPEQPA